MCPMVTPAGLGGGSLASPSCTSAKRHAATRSNLIARSPPAMESSWMGSRTRVLSHETMARGFRRSLLAGGSGDQSLLGHGFSEDGRGRRIFLLRVCEEHAAG